MVGRILRTADFERALAQAPRSRSTHFAAHHVAAGPAAPARGGSKPSCTELSTDSAPSCPPAVDDLPGGWWLGTVVPKRHARRSVTRNLIKRQMREVMQTAAAQLPQGLWVLRLKSVFDPKQFPSPASGPLRQAAREEIALLLSRAASPRTAGSGEPRRRSRAESAAPATPATPA
ncbi:MAG: ribonuclease P protein component [Ideonella sp.]|nr:ribonuclease P protein component [Ideonella sp.]MBL0149856.1 ribonuclease P protein component [Ideonella sp.]